MHHKSYWYAVAIMAILCVMLFGTIAYKVACAQPDGPNPSQLHNVYEPFTVEVAIRDR